MQAVTVDNQGNIKLNATAVTLDELSSKLEAIKAATPDSPIVVRGDSATQYQVVMDVLTAVGRADLVLKLTLPLVPLAVVGHFFAIPAFGTSGAAIVTSVGSVLAALAQIVVVQLYWGILPAPATFVRALLATLLAGAFVSLLPAPGALLILKLPAACLFSLLVLYLFGEFSRGEIAAARSLLPVQRVPFRH